MVDINVLIVTGLYNSGQRELEDALKNQDIYSIHNLPVQLIKELIFEKPDFLINSEFLKTRKIAFFVDISSGDEFASELVNFKAIAKEKNIPTQFIYLEQSKSNLINRYKEKRLKHTHSELNLSDAIDQEIGLAENIKDISEYIFNVDNKSSRELKVQFRNLLNKIYAKSDEFVIEIQSFGYKYGLPMDSDLVLDVRFLPNPYYLPELRELIGLDQDIKIYLEQFKDTYTSLDMFEQDLKYLLPKYAEDGRNILQYSIGCTGGKHRSVYVVEELAKRLIHDGYKVVIRHRDIGK